MAANGSALPLYGTHALRPNAGAVPDGSTYKETDTGKSFQAQAGSWVEISSVPVADLPAQNAEVAASSTLAPSATISTYGTAVTLSPGTGYSSLLPTVATFTANSIGSETLTYRITLTFSDASTASVTQTATTTATKTFTLTELLPGFAGKSGLSVASVAFDTKSSIGSSTATVTLAGLAFDN